MPRPASSDCRGGQTYFSGTREPARLERRRVIGRDGGSGSALKLKVKLAAGQCGAVASVTWPGRCASSFRGRSIMWRGAATSAAIAMMSATLVPTSL